MIYNFTCLDKICYFIVQYLLSFIVYIIVQIIKNVNYFQYPVINASNVFNFLCLSRSQYLSFLSICVHGKTKNGIFNLVIRVAANNIHI
jgi:hypothetical protein